MATKKAGSAKSGKTASPAVDKKPIDTTPEGKNTRFKEVAGRRLKKIVQQIQLLGNCSNRNVYNYTPDNVKYIFTLIEEQTAACKQKYMEKAKESKEIKIEL